MLYRFLKILFSITTKFYFNKLQVSGENNIPLSGPVIFVANHPSAFMDPIVIATITKRKLFFLAKGALFQTKFFRWLFPKFNMIPIFRNDETPGQSHKNKEVFSLCFNHLKKEGAILIFPEGISLTERKLQKIKTGTARIALGAEAENNFKLNLKIIVVGLNFSNPHQFQSNLFVNIDDPISLKDYEALYEEDSFKAAKSLTEKISEKLQKQIIAIEDVYLDKLVANIELIYKAQLLVDLGHSPKLMENDFMTTKSIYDSVAHFNLHEPQRVEKIKNEIDTYLNSLEHLSLNDAMLNSLGKTKTLFKSMLSIFYLIVGLPIFIFGFINNFLAYKIPGWLAGLISKRQEFYGSISLTLGTFIFILFYSVQIYLIHHYFNDYRTTLVYAILLPFSGLFAYYYFRRFTTAKGKWKIFSLFYKKTNLIASLITKRTEIINALELGKSDFLKLKKQNLNLI